MKNPLVKRLLRPRTLLTLLFVVIFAVIAVVLFTNPGPATSSLPSSTIDLFPTVTDEDVFSDPIYVKLRTEEYGYITYEGETLFLEDQTGDYTKQDVFCRFFRDFFDCIVAGDVAEYKSFFVTPPRIGDFTTQKIININILQTDQGETEWKGEKVATRNFIITYNIYQNNGTFRSDLSQSKYEASGAFRQIAIEEIYTIAHVDGGWKIISISRSKIF